MAAEAPPDWLEIERGENRAFIALRSADEPVADWGELIAEAQYVIGRSRHPVDGGFDHLLDPDRAADLIAASRILDNASQAREGSPPGSDAGPTGEEQIGPLHLLAAAAYAMHGNFCSAGAVIRRQNPDFGRLSPVRAAIAATCAPDLIGSALDRVRNDSRAAGDLITRAADRMGWPNEGLSDQRAPATEAPSEDRSPAIREYLETFEAFLRTGEEGPNPGELRRGHRACFSPGWSPFDMALWGACGVALAQAVRLSTARNLVGIDSPFSAEYIAALTRTGVRTLFPPQWRAVASGALTDRERRNCLISLPTSAGKTLLAELALAASLLGSGPNALGCYVVPYVALGTQVARKLRNHFRGIMAIHQAFGTHPLADGTAGQDISGIIVATPERFDSLLRNQPEMLDRLRCVVFDEAHLVERGTRGVRIEGLITRLRLRQEFGNTANGGTVSAGRLRIVLVSAVLENYDGLLGWLGGKEKAVLVTDTWKPTAQRLAVWREEGRLSWHVGMERIAVRGLPAKTTLGSVRLPWPQQDFRPARSRNQAQARPQLTRAYANVAYLVEYLRGAFPRQPILCVCATRQATRLLAAALADRLPEPEAPGTLVTRALHLVATKHTFLRQLAACLRRGVAYHNSAVPHDVRELIEEAVKAEELLAVASTTTLAEGVDLPFRLTVLADWLHFGDEGMQPISPRLFKNIAGRSGRAGIYTEGDTIVFDNPVGDANLVHPLYRRRDQERVLFGDGGEGERLGSAIARSVEAKGAPDLVASLESQFMAAIGENPGADDLGAAFSEHTFARRTRNGEDMGGNRLAAWFGQISGTLLNTDHGEAFARRNSPIVLTELGQAANRTTFSPSSCQSIIAWLKSAEAGEDDAALAARLLRDLGHLPEQPLDKFRAAVRDPQSKAARRYCVHPEHLELITGAWLAGSTTEHIFGILPNNRSSSRKPRVNEWLGGLAPAPNWDEEFDRFIDFVQSVLSGFLPWLLGACGTLDRHLGHPGAGIDWDALAKRFEESERSATGRGGQ